MENKQLESEDLLMNKKEELIWKVIDNVISCCAITRIDGAKSITREDVVGKSREENVVITRCLVVEQMVHAGFTISTIAFILNRTVQATRHLLKLSTDYYETSRAFRLATSEIRRMKMEIQELEECLDKYEERDNRYDDDPQYRNRNPYDDEERYHEREEYGHRERGRYGRY